MLNQIKRGLLFLSLSLALLVKTVNAQYTSYSLIGTFTYMGQLIRDLLYGIAAILSPILTRELFVGPWGYVYGRLILGILVGIFVYISAKRIFEERKVANPERFAKVVTVLLTLSAVIGIPDNVIYLFFFTPMFIGIIAVVLALSFLKGDGRLVWALKGLTYLVIVLMLGWFGNVVGYNEISGLVIGLGSLIFLIAGLYYLFGSFWPSGGWLGGLGRGGGGPEEGAGGGGAGEAIGGALGKGVGGLWGLGKGALKWAWDATKAEVVTRKIRKSLQEELNKKGDEIKTLENIRRVLNEINTHPNKIDEKTIKKILKGIFGLLNDIQNNKKNSDKISKVVEDKTKWLQEVDIKISRELINKINDTQKRNDIKEDKKRELEDLSRRIYSKVREVNEIAEKIGTTKSGPIHDCILESDEFIAIISNLKKALENKEFEGGEALCIAAINKDKELIERLTAIDAAYKIMGEKYAEIMDISNGFQKQYENIIKEGVASETKKEQSRGDMEEIISKKIKWEREIDAAIGLLSTFERNLSSRNWDEEIYNTIVRSIGNIINNLERELPYVKIRDLAAMLSDLDKSVKDIKKNLARAVFEGGIRGDPLNVLIPNAMKNIKSLKSKLIDLKDKISKPVF